jgi:hypothetical protein
MDCRPGLHAHSSVDIPAGASRRSGRFSAFLARIGYQRIVPHHTPPDGPTG